MSVDALLSLDFDNSFARELTGLYEPWQPAPAPSPRLLTLNVELAGELGLDPAALASPEGVAVLAGNVVPDGATPLAQAYAGHQFGSYSPRLGDGRALLLGEIVDIEGRRRDLHLKGSGRTPFARGGDGKAVVGPMLREYLISEAMHALGIPTTRALAVVATGERVSRETGAARRGADPRGRQPPPRRHVPVRGGAPATATLLQRLADYAIARHYPAAADADVPALAPARRRHRRTGALVAQWMLVGFVHGVMNTDNMTISGETIDYGPCAFMDAYDPATVFSSIDHGGRYAYGNQPAIAQWNLARLAEALLPLIDPVVEAAVEAATETLRTFNDRFLSAWSAGLRTKLGLAAGDTSSLGDDLIELMRARIVSITPARSGRCRRACAARRRRPSSLPGSSGGGRPSWPVTGPWSPSPPTSTPATRSTSLATTWSRRRWTQRWPVTSPRSSTCSTSCPIPSSSAPARSATPNRPATASPRPSRRSAAPDPGRVRHLMSQTSGVSGRAQYTAV